MKEENIKIKINVSKIYQETIFLLIGLEKVKIKKQKED